MPGQGVAGQGAAPRVLLLGAGGFLGRHLASALVGAGLWVHAPRGDLSAAGAAEWDGFWADLPGDGPPVIVNAAGRVAGTWDELTRANVLLTAGALAAAGRAGARLIHLASAAEYGRAPVGHASREDDPAAPTSAYGATKLAATVLVETAARRGDVDAVALRLTNPVGAGQSAQSLPGRAARLLLAARQAGEAQVRFGPLEAERDFFAATDVGRAALHLLPGQPGAQVRGAVNLGSGEARSARWLVARLAALMDFGGEVTEDAPPAAQVASTRSADVPYQRADLSRLRGSGFVPTPDLDAALLALIASVGREAPSAGPSPVPTSGLISGPTTDLTSGLPRPCGRPRR